MAPIDQLSVNLSGKVALVTGGGKGIGAAIAFALSRAGAATVVADIDDRSGQKVVAELNGSYGRALYARANVAFSADVDSLFRTVLSDFGRVDILVNNAGIWFRKPMLDISDQEWDEVMTTNLKGTFMCTQRAARIMVEQKSGCVVNIASQAGLFYSRGQGCHYAASKAAIVQLTRVLAFELGPFGIRINCIAPGSLSVSATSKSGPLLDHIPLRRSGTADDVAQAVLFFASDHSSFITGQTLLVNGGVITSL